MIKSKRQLSYYSYVGKGLEILIPYNYNECEEPVDIADNSGTSSFSVKNAKILFRKLAKILKAEVKVKVWCGECSGSGNQEVDMPQYGDCPICRGLGYKEQIFVEEKRHN